MIVLSLKLGLVSVRRRVTVRITVRITVSITVRVMTKVRLVYGLRT